VDLFYRARLTHFHRSFRLLVQLKLVHSHRSANGVSSGHISPRPSTRSLPVSHTERQRFSPFSSKISSSLRRCRMGRHPKMSITSIQQPAEQKSTDDEAMSPLWEEEWSGQPDRRFGSLGIVRRRLEVSMRLRGLVEIYLKYRTQ